MHPMRETLSVDKAPVADPAHVPPMHRVADSALDRKAAGRVKLRGKCMARGVYVNGARVEPADFDGGDYSCEFYVYDDRADWAGLASKVETAPTDTVRAAEAMHRRKVAEYIAKALRMQPDDVPDDPAQWSEAMRAASNRCPSSVEARFHEILGRSLRPLRDIEVVMRDVPPPQSRVEQHGNAQTKALVSALAELGFGGGSATADQIAAAVKAALRGKNS